MPGVVYFNIAADDPERAAQFYEEALGWKVSKLAGPVTRWTIETGEEDEPGIDGGISYRSEDWQSVTSFIEVSSIGKALDDIESAGGSVVQARIMIPGIGYVAAFEDTEGNVLGLIESSEGDEI